MGGPASVSLARSTSQKDTLGSRAGPAGWGEPAVHQQGPERPCHHQGCQLLTRSSPRERDREGTRGTAEHKPHAHVVAPGSRVELVWTYVCACARM